MSLRFSTIHNSLLLLLPVALLIVISGAFFWAGLSDMVHKWNTKEEYGHAYFIPLITAFLIYQRKSELFVAGFQPGWSGVLVMLMAGGLFILGEIATTYTLVQYSFVLFLFGLAWAFMSWKAFKLVIWPMALLFFIVPLPPFILNNLSGQLQLISSEIGVWVIRLFGISVFLEGNVIDLGTYKLQVVEACSGLNYLFPLMSLSFIVAYLFKVEFWKRSLVFLSSIPITILMNSFRIGVIGLLVENSGVKQAEGFLHLFEGWIVFMACLMILLLEVSLLARIGKQRSTLQQVFNLGWPEPLPVELRNKPFPTTWPLAGIAGVITLMAIGAMYVGEREGIIPARAVFSDFPQQVGGWEGQENSLEQIYLDSLKLDDYFLADYKNPLGEQIYFYVAYYDSQEAGSAAHSPRACIPGGGWQIEKVTQVSVPEILIGEVPLSVNRLVIKRGDYKQLVYYWFQQRGRVITSEWLVKLYLFQDGLLRQRTDGALVRLTTAIKAGENWTDGDRRLAEFTKTVAPLLSQYVPD